MTHPYGWTSQWANWTWPTLGPLAQAGVRRGMAMT